MTRSRRTRRPKFNFNTQETRTSLTVQSLTVKRVMKKFIFFLAWLSNISLKTLKPFISAPERLIDKRGLICDHSQLINISLNFGRMFVYFLRNICLLLILFNFDRDRNLNLNLKTFWNISTAKAWNFKVNLPASCKSNGRTEVNLWSH